VRTEGISICAAVVLHGALLLVARGMPPLALVTDADLRELRTIDVEFTPTPPLEARHEIAPVPTEEAPRPTDAERPPERVAAAGRPVVPGPEGPKAIEPPSETNPQPRPAGTQGPTKFDDLPDEPHGGVLGVPGAPGVPGNAMWGMPGVLEGGARAPAPTAAPAPRPVDRDIAGKVVREAMTANDKDKGIDLPAAGTLAAALADTIQGSDVPNVSRASIVFRIGAGGQVLGYQVLSQSGGGDAWERAARAAAARVAGRLVMTGNYARGAVITVNVVSNDQPPAGSKGGLAGAGVAFDMSNIGAHATRSIRTGFSVRPL
jgi:hypothetical protein